jgi:hypothetical protein
VSKYRFARFIAIVLLILAVLVLVGGIVGSLVIGDRGLGSGWSEGWRGWFTVPMIAASCSGAFWLLLLGSVLLVLVDISNNMARIKLAAAQKPVFVETPVAELPAEVTAAPVEAVLAPAADAVVAAPVVPVAAAATAVAVEEKATRKPKASTAPPSAKAKGMTATRAQAEAEARAAAERAEAVPVGVPVAEPDAAARSATVEITEAPAAAVEQVAPAPKPKRTRKAAAAAVVTAAAVAAAEKPAETPAAVVITPADENLLALAAAVDALEAAAGPEALVVVPETAPTEPRLPGAEDAARIAAELAAIKAVDTGATKPKRERKPAKFSARLVYVGGISEATADRLSEVGVRTTEDLLERGSTRKGRQELAEQTGLSAREILTWVNHSDLFRIRGVGEEYALLLEASGVDTVVELAQRNATNLQARLVAVNDEQHLVRQVPVLTQVERWIEDAKALPRVVKY